jgi:hypothetical protein
MRNLCFVAIFLAGASLLFGQLDSDTVTIQASRSIYLTPDQVVLSVSVTTGAGFTLDQVVAALSTLTITTAHLSSVAGGTDTQSPVYWRFTLSAPLAKMKATIASLTALQQSLAQNNSGVTLMFQVQGSQVSSDLIQSQACSMKDLVADAQAQAQTVASAGGVAMGPIVALSDLSSGGTPSSRLGSFVFNGYAGIIGSIYVPFLAQRVITIPVSTPIICSLEVKFKLLRY